MELKIGEYKIRSWKTGDAAPLVKYANNRNVWINLRDGFPYPYTTADALAWIRFAGRQEPEVNFVIASAKEPLGAIGLTLQEDVHRLSAEIGYWLGEPFWGKGIATRAVRLLTDWAFTEFQLERIYAGVFEWNPASVSVLEKAGYSFEGRLRKSVIKDGKVIDQLLYARLRDE